jgi:hypothetical protein
VDLEQEPTLLSIFKGGLRPFRVLGLEHRECEVRPGITASFKVGGVIIPPLKAVWEFKFNGDDIPRVLRGYTESAYGLLDTPRIRPIAWTRRSKWKGLGITPRKPCSR